MKKNVIVKLKDLSPEIQSIMLEQYPYGFEDDVIKVAKGNNQHFYAVIVETEEVKYLVKVDIKVDMLLETTTAKKTAEKEKKEPEYAPDDSDLES